MSIRTVPLHAQLIAAGFLDFYKSCASSKHVQLFPLLRGHASGASFVSLWFSRLLTQAGLKTPALSLHSLRHTLAVKLERERTHYSLQRRLSGHSAGSDVESRVYLGSFTYTVGELSEALEKVRYPSL